MVNGPEPSDRPRVTLGVPLYNAAEYLEQAFDSWLAQDYPWLEIVVCDNASTDTTPEICDRYAAADPRVRVYRNRENRGAAYNFNRVVELARGDLFRWTAYDDWCAPTLVTECVAALDRGGPEVVLAYPRTVLIDDAGQVVRYHDDRFDIRHRRPWRRAGHAGTFSLCNPIFGVIRVEALRRTGMIRPYPSSDVTLLAELAALGHFHEVPERLFYRRIHQQSSRQGRGGNRHALPGVARWFDPQSTGSSTFPRLRLTARTARALWQLEGGPSRRGRLACAAAFALAYGLRRARITAGRARQRALTMVARRRSRAIVTEGATDVDN